MAQWRQIQRIQGVQVAAPIAMIGYVFVTAAVLFDLPAADYDQPGRQLYRISTTWVSADGSSRITQPPSYIYVTPDRLSVKQDTAVTDETLPGGSQVPACASASPLTDDSPFGRGQTTISCGSKQSGWLFGGEPAVIWEFPTFPVLATTSSGVGE